MKQALYTALIAIACSPSMAQRPLKLIAGGVQTAHGVNSPSGILNAASYCPKLGTFTQACIENAINASSGGAVFVPAGTYTGTDSSIHASNLHLILDPAAKLDYDLNISGSGFFRKNTVSSARSYPIGTTTFSGDFSGYTAGQIVVIEQVVNNGNVPVDFATVSSASATSLLLTSGTRFSYVTPNISVISNIVSVSGATARGANSIAGNYTDSLAVGDMVRIENTKGTDGPEGTNAYFEVARVGAINSSAITFETALHSTFGNPWLAKMQVLSNITIEGNSGYVHQLVVDNARRVNVHGLNTNTVIAQYLYDFQFSRLRGATTGPSAFFFTFLWNGTVSDVVAYGGTGTTDNGNVKFLGVQGVAVSNVATWQGTDTSQGEYPLMFDFNYTPYSLWNAGDTLSSAAVGSSTAMGGASIFVGGMRNSNVSSLVNNGNVVFLASDGLTINGFTTTGQILIQSGKNYKICNFIADSMAIGQFAAVTDSSFEGFTILGGVSENGSSAINVLGGSNLRLIHGEFIQSDLTFFTINAQAGSTNLYYEDLQDYAGRKLLFSVHTNGTGTSTMMGNRFASAIQGPILTLSLPSIAAGMTIGGGVAISSSTALPQVKTPTVGRAACILASGPPVVVGFCSTAISGSGACTCN